MKKEGKLQTSSELLDFSDVTVDDEGNAVVDHEIVVNQQMRLFGEKVYGLSQSVTDLFTKDEDRTQKQLVNDLSKTVSSVIVEDLKGEYNLKTRETDQIKKQITATFENEFEKRYRKKNFHEAHNQGRICNNKSRKQLIRSKRIRFKKILINV